MADSRPYSDTGGAVDSKRAYDNASASSGANVLLRNAASVLTDSKNYAAAVIGALK